MSSSLFVVTSPLGQKVTLTENCYTYHIVVEHPDIEDVEIIKEVIQSPNSIARDAMSRDRLVYYQGKSSPETN